MQPKEISKKEVSFLKDVLCVTVEQGRCSNPSSIMTYHLLQGLGLHPLSYPADVTVPIFGPSAWLITVREARKLRKLINIEIGLMYSVSFCYANTDIRIRQLCYAK